MNVNLISAFSFTEFAEKAWDALTSEIALIVYAAIILVLILVIVIRVAVSEHRRVAEIRANDERRKEVHENELLETVQKDIDKKMDVMNGEIAAVRSALTFAPHAANKPAVETPAVNYGAAQSFVPPHTGTPAGNGAAQPPAPSADGSPEGTGEETEEGGSRFYMLTEIDREYEHYTPPAYDDKISLKEICESFRDYSAGKLKLYYEIEDIRRFIGALAVTKLIILQGMSGTGKTSLAYAFGEYLDNKTVIVPIQPMWKERTDLVGYYNEFTKKFNETTLLYKMYEADNNDEIYITVLDEMNIARVEYYFAEFLSLLEIPNPEGRNLDVVADRRDDDPKLIQHDGKLRLPTNMWFVGTANNDDSTFSISDKVYDRAMVINLDKKATPFEAEGKGKKISAPHLEELIKKAQREYGISDRNLRRIKKLDEYMIKTFHITFGNRIMKQIKSYVPVLVACGGTELEGMDDILARKVFRKLESKNPVYVKQMADGVCAYIDGLFGEDKLPQCKETIRLIEQNV